MPSFIALVHDLVEAVVFGNGWLVAAGLALVGVLVVLVRVVPMVRV